MRWAWDRTAGGADRGGARRRPSCRSTRLTTLALAHYKTARRVSSSPVFVGSPVRRQSRSLPESVPRSDCPATTRRSPSIPPIGKPSSSPAAIRLALRAQLRTPVGGGSLLPKMGGSARSNLQDRSSCSWGSIARRRQRERADPATGPLSGRSWAAKRGQRERERAPLGLARSLLSPGHGFEGP